MFITEAHNIRINFYRQRSGLAKSYRAREKEIEQAREIAREYATEKGIASHSLASDDDNREGYSPAPEQHWPFAHGHRRDGPLAADVKGLPRRQLENVLVAATGPVQRGRLDRRDGFGPEK